MLSVTDLIGKSQQLVYDYSSYERYLWWKVIQLRSRHNGADFATPLRATPAVDARPSPPPTGSPLVIEVEDTEDSKPKDGRR